MDSVPRPWADGGLGHPAVTVWRRPRWLRWPEPTLIARIVPGPSGETQLHLDGALVPRTLPVLRGALAEALAMPADRLVLDLSGLRRMAPRGLAALAEARAQGERVGVQVTVANPTEHLRDCVVRANLHPLIEWHDA